MSIWINLIILHVIFWFLSSKIYVFYGFIVCKSYRLLIWFFFVLFFYFLIFKVTIFFFTYIFWISIAIVSVILISIYSFFTLFFLLSFLFCLEQVLLSWWRRNISTLHPSSIWTLDSVLIISFCTLV